MIRSRFWIALCLALPLVSQVAAADVVTPEGASVRNGGKGVVCKNEQQQISSIQLYDYYELEQVWEMEFRDFTHLL